MKFIKLNWKKIIIRWVFNLLWIEFLFSFIYLHKRGNGNNLIINLLVLPAIIGSTLVSFVTVLLNMFSFNLGYRYCKDPNGFRTLFDSEPQLQVAHQKSFFTYAKMLLDGNIRGIPTELEYNLNYTLPNRSEAKSTQSNLKGTFQIVNSFHKPQTIIQEFNLEIDLKFRIRNDYQAEVLSFVEKLKSKQS